jgi:hypothetical protein
MQPNTEVSVIRDIFHTFQGSWEPVDPANPYSVYQTPDWARADYLHPFNSPYYNDDGGADTHILACLFNSERAPIPGAGFAFTSDGPSWLQPPSQGKVAVMVGKPRHGWANLFMSKPGSTCYPPSPGPWSLSRLGMSDIVSGFGLPLNHHVSFFASFQTVLWSQISTPVWTDRRAAMLTLAAQHQRIQFNFQAALQAKAWADGFVPNSPEFDFSMADGTKYRAQRFEKPGSPDVRIYASKINDWSNVFFEAV